MLVCYFHSCLSHQLVHHNCAVVKYQISICNGYWYIIYHIYCSNIYSNYHILNTMVCMYIYIISYMLSCKYNLIIINYLFIHMRVTGYDTKRCLSRKSIQACQCHLDFYVINWFLRTASTKEVQISISRIIHVKIFIIVQR